VFPSVRVGGDGAGRPGIVAGLVVPSRDKMVAVEDQFFDSYRAIEPGP
jgi:hypothetical protein